MIKNNHVTKIGALILLGQLTGCASITGTTGQSVSVQTRDKSGKEISDAKCDLVNSKGTWFVTTPGSVSIHRSNDDLQILCKKEGEENGRVAVVSTTKGSMFGNIVFGGGVGAIIDHSNGSAYEYPTLIEVVMGAFSKVEPPKREMPNNPNPMMGAAPSVDTSVGGKQQKLAELKQLHDQGLITPEVYAERQKALLEGN